MAASKHATCAEHDCRVLTDAARQLEAAARVIRRMAKDTRRWPIVAPTTAEVSMIHANINAALARLPRME